MFLEQIEVLEYRRKLEVEQSTFPDSTNTETSRKLFISLTCVCVSVCAKKFSVDIVTKKKESLENKLRFRGKYFIIYSNKSRIVFHKITVITSYYATHAF